MKKNRSEIRQSFILAIVNVVLVAIALLVQDVRIMQTEIWWFDILIILAGIQSVYGLIYFVRGIKSRKTLMYFASVLFNGVIAIFFLGIMAGKIIDIVTFLNSL